MRTLYLVRHAEAVSRKKNVPDFERSLVQKGVKEAKRMAKRLARADRHPELLISSPANRAIETAHIFADAIGYDVERVLLKPEIYEGRDDDSLVQTITSIQDDCAEIVLFGHDPSLSRFVSRVLPGFNLTVPKGGVVGVTFDVDSWQDISTRPGHAVAFFFPLSKTEKEHALSALRNTLEEGLTEQLRDYLSSIDSAIAETLGKDVRKTASRAVGLLFKEMRKKDLLQLYWQHAASRNEQATDQETSRT